MVDPNILGWVLFWTIFGFGVGFCTHAMTTRRLPRHRF